MVQCHLPYKLKNTNHGVDSAIGGENSTDTNSSKKALITTSNKILQKLDYLRMKEEVSKGWT